MENNQLIVIKQLPEIEEHLKDVSMEIDKKVDTAKTLVCNEDNKQTIKKIRAELNKELEEFEKMRKDVKEKVLAPYTRFEEVYKTYISDKYKSADKELKIKIDEVENQIKQEKEQELKEYFEEYKNFKNIRFIIFEQANIKVGLSDTITSLKKQIQIFIDKVFDDVNLINTQGHKEEIMVEYKETLNVNQAIATVTNRYKAIEEEKKNQEIVSNSNEVNTLNQKKLIENNKSDEFVIVPTKKEIIVKFYINNEEEKRLKQFLNLSNIKYESEDLR